GCEQQLGHRQKHVGKVFDEFGTKYWEELLRDAKKFCKEKFGEVKDHSTVTLVVVELQRGIPAVTVGDKIELSAHYIVEKKNDKKEIKGVIYHESVHVWQNNEGNYRDAKFRGVIEGVADWIRLRADLAPPHWKKAPSAHWYDGYETTAYFLDWICYRYDENFVKKLNKKMKNSWSEDFFQQIVHKEVEELWNEYKRTP
ncbi:uncharacterized protein, partial [Physcomitrium patens]|uniref:uncharacterized protein n=1 Tax=Physcomitrium patens TaxID=3218 RepID=UPI003CCCDE02